MQKSLSELFEVNFASNGEIGAAFCVADTSSDLVLLAGGRVAPAADAEKWSGDTLSLLWSATKGIVSAVLLGALTRNRLSLDEAVASVCPAFGASGKEAITFRQILQHSAGLPVLDDPTVSMDSPDGILAAIEKQSPVWEPGKRHGYHAMTYGYLVEGIVRALTGRTVADFWEEHFRISLGIDIFLGVPPVEDHRVATVIAPGGLSDAPHDRAFYAAMAERESLTARAFASPRGLRTASAMNQPAARRAGYPSMGAYGSARGLARFYALLAAEARGNGKGFLGDPGPELVGTGVEGEDAILRVPTAFNCGFMRDPLMDGGGKIRSLFGPGEKAFGQPGAGGIHGFADPSRGLGFGYVMNAMRPGLFPNEKSLCLIESFYALD